MTDQSNQPSRVHGNSTYYQGAAKELTGRVTGNEQMKLEGEAEKLKGQGEIDAAKLQQRAEGAKDKVTGTVEETAGNVIGNERMQAEGAATRIKGDYKA
ncbi:8989_t:CDS:2 [Acaulospora morrowiae]|uniref:8989_t:CDS:1 n=1 Tax=Acaulospora morrowiae TaxID=94023 RepID=A0A9N9HRH8_9GLOM|nr:8989_t:CDS:2 [Acaulospora morrowiae]